MIATLQTEWKKYEKWFWVKSLECWLNEQRELKWLSTDDKLQALICATFELDSAMNPKRFRAIS